MEVQILQNGDDLAVARGGGDGVAREHRAVELDEQLHRDGPLQQRRAEFLRAPGLLQRGEQGADLVVRACAVDVLKPALRLLEARGEIVVRRAVFLEKFGRDVEDHPLVEVALPQLRAVDAAAADHDEVTRRELVPLALDAVPRSPREQEDDLVKRVVVVGNLRPIAVGEVEEAEILPQIPPLFVLLWLHESTSCIVGGSIIA